MGNKIKVALAIVTTLLFAACNKDEDPGPKLDSTISFLYDIPAGGSYTFFVVVADTSGNVLSWKEIPVGKETSLPYPKNPDLVTLSMVTRFNLGNNRAFITTFTSVPGGKYTMSPEEVTKPADDGIFKLSLVVDHDDFTTWGQYVSGDFGTRKASRTGNVDNYEFGLYDDEMNNVLFWGMNTSSGEMLYLYREDVNAGDSIGLSAQSLLNELPAMPAHAVNYPDHKNSATGTSGRIVGLDKNGGGYSLSSRNWETTDDPVLYYPDIANLFPFYITEITSDDTEYGYYQRNKGTVPVLNFSNMNPTLTTVNEINAKRISIDVTGDADLVYLGGGFGSGTTQVGYELYIPMGSKVRVNLPQFPADIITEIPVLDKVKEGEGSFYTIYFDDYEESYATLYSHWIENGFELLEPNMRSKGSYLESNGRRSAEMQPIMKRFETKNIFNAK